MFRNVLFVCVGNICRSPTAALVLRQALAGTNIEVGSAGLKALHGHRIDATAQAVLDAHGLDGSTHTARQLLTPMLHAADLILTMERRHAHAIARTTPAVSGKVFALGRWLGDDDVPDPYRRPRPAFEHAYALIERGVASWMPYLR